MLSKSNFEKPAIRLGGKIPVYMSDELPDHQMMTRNLERWSKTKGLTLAGVTRIDVIPRVPSLKILGDYNLFFSVIRLTRPTSPARGIRRWFRNLDSEFTFYHEVGHHALGHIEGGVVKEQEEEANEYARSMIRKSHPVLTTVFRILIWPMRPILARLIPRVAARSKRNPEDNQTLP